MVDRGKIEKTGSIKFDKMPSRNIQKFTPQRSILCSFNCSFKGTTNLKAEIPPQSFNKTIFLAQKRA